MSVLGAHVASVLGAFRSSVLGARGSGDGGGEPIPIAFERIWECVGPEEDQEGTRRIQETEVLYEWLPALQPFFAEDGYRIWQISVSSVPGDSTYPGGGDQYYVRPTQQANPSGRATFLAGQGYVVTEYTEAAWYALEPWGGLDRFEQIVRPVGPKLLPSLQSASFITLRTPTSYPALNVVRPDPALSDLLTSPRYAYGDNLQRAIGWPVITEPGANQYLSVTYGNGYDAGSRGILSGVVSSGVSTDITGPTSPIVDIQGQGPTQLTNVYRAIFVQSLSDAFIYEPVSVGVAPSPTLFEMLEIDTSTVRDPGYIDAGAVANLDGGFCFRWDADLGGIGNRQGLDVYYTDTPLNSTVINANGIPQTIMVNSGFP